MGNHESYEDISDHARFSKVQYSSNTLAMIVREPIIFQSQSIEPWEQKQRLYAHIYNSNDIARPIEHKVEVSGVCGGSCTFVAKFDDKYVTTLKEQITDRQLNKTHYTEQQLWYILLLLTRCATHIYSYGERHIIGNIHPYNVLINRKGQYKILCTNFSYSLPGQLDHFEEYRIHGDSRAFVSPELLGFLSNTKYADYPQYPRCVDKQACQAFCLGLTLLSMATLETNIMKIFKAQNGTINRNLNINSRISAGQSNNSMSTPDPYYILSNNLSNAFNTVESIPADPSLAKKQSKAVYSQAINQQYLNCLLAKVKQQYSSIFSELITSFLYSDPDIRIKADRLYRDYLTPVQKEIETFDRSWLDLVESQSTPLSKSILPDVETNSNHGIGRFVQNEQ